MFAMTSFRRNERRRAPMNDNENPAARTARCLVIAYPIPQGGTLNNDHKQDIERFKRNRKTRGLPELF
jgi:hypothetical protein